MVLKLKLPEKKPESWQIEKLKLATSMITELQAIHKELREIKKLLKDLTEHE